MYLSLAASTPYVLQHTIPLCQSVQGIIRFSHRPYESAESIDLALAREPAILVNLANRYLNRGVILGFNDAIGSAALTRHVTGDEEYMISNWSRELEFQCCRRRRTGRRVLPYRFPWLRLQRWGFWIWGCRVVLKLRVACRRQEIFTNFEP